jgi:hypothetical protein
LVGFPLFVIQLRRGFKRIHWPIACKKLPARAIGRYQKLQRGLAIGTKIMGPSKSAKLNLRNNQHTFIRVTKPLLSSLAWITHVSRNLVRHGVLAGIVAGLLPAAVRLALLPLAPIPVPAIHDEFSYLLGADTFAHFRLTNPPHPFWQHFESFHILQQPSYMSMYPPGNALVFAFGQVFLGHPWFGLCIVLVLLGIGSYWALRAWAPQMWALPGALLVGADFGIADYWINSYWGGAAAALGGVLVVGSAGYLLNRVNGTRVRNAILFATGVLILANTRPWEGLLFCTGVAIFAGARLSSRNPRCRAALLHRWLGVVLFSLTIGGVLMAYYCWRGTGSAFEFPYLLNRRTYATAMLFFWQKPKPAPSYNHEEMRRFYLDWEPSFQAESKPFRPRTFSSRLHFLERVTLNNVPRESMHWVFRVFVFPVLFLLVLWTCWRGANTRWLVCLCAFFYAGICCQNYCQLHYVAPFLGAGILLKITAVRRWSLAFGRSGEAVGIGVLYLLVLGFIGWNSSRVISMVPKPDSFGARRENLNQTLQRMPGRHLVIVRYSPEHSPHEEWVYNAADLDAAKVVWARDMGLVRDRALSLYFRNRHAWLLEPDRDPNHLESFENATWKSQ